MQRLRALGWIEGQTVAIEYRWAEGRTEHFPGIVAELVRLRVDIIVPTSTAAALASKQATAVIPIVFPLSGDPLGTGLIASLGRPGGNITGLSNQAADLGGKRIEFLRDMTPGLRRLAILANAEYPGRTSEIADIRAADGRDAKGANVVFQIGLDRRNHIPPPWRVTTPAQFG